MTDTLAPPPPAAADPPPARTPLKLEMIQPPVRGDVPAWRWFWFGIGFYVLFAVLLVGTLLRVSGDQSRPAALLQMFGLGGAHWNLPLFALVVGGVWLTVRAALMVRDDIGTLAREEEDIDWVLKTRENGVALVFLDPAERARRFAAGEHTLPADARIEVETLLDDRVRRVFEAAQASGATHVPVDELRGIAEKRTARLGGFARFASSLLLLLAVLGTFAGVKTALPSLIDAVAAAGGTGSESNPASPSGTSSSATASSPSSPSSPSPSSQSSANPLVEPLRAVADAFGGNALALVGAIAVGLMAQGLAFGRRNLLERLELVSAEYIYDRRRSGSADPLRVAVETLADTAGEVRDATQSLSGIEGELQGLSEAFREAFESLNERLTDIVVQQDSMLHQRTSESLDQLGRHVAALAQTVDANTRAYAGIVDRVGERSAEARAALERMEDANRALTLALEGISRLGDVSGQAAAAVEERLAAIGLGTMQVRERMDGIADEVERARPALETMEVALRSATDRIAGIDERAAKAWAAAAEQINTRLEKIAAAPAAVATSGGGGGMSADAVSLLRRIATGVEASRPPSPVMLATLPLLGTLGAIAIVYVLWEGVPRLLALFGIG
jgi:methyl-accepting chemotaxis protein